MHWQIRKPPLATEHCVQFGDFLVALVVAAFGDEFACDGELRAGFLQQPRGLRGVGGRGSGGARFDEAVQRREGFPARERERSTTRQLIVASAARLSPTKAMPSMRPALPRQAVTVTSTRN